MLIQSFPYLRLSIKDKQFYYHCIEKYNYYGDEKLSLSRFNDSFSSLCVNSCLQIILMYCVNLVEPTILNLSVG
jgi:hypothetical protein